MVSLVQCIPTIESCTYLIVVVSESYRRGVLGPRAARSPPVVQAEAELAQVFLAQPILVPDENLDWLPSQRPAVVHLGLELCLARAGSVPRWVERLRHRRGGNLPESSQSDQLGDYVKCLTCSPADLPLYRHT